jgi:carbonic anhydrase
MLEFLKEGFKDFKKNYYENDKSYIDNLVKSGQRPKFMVIACSDSRVDPAILFQTKPGEVFAVRNVANLVPPYSPDKGHHGVSAAIEFGVLDLKIEHIIVLGHAHCGGIKTLCNNYNAGVDILPTKNTQREFIDSWMNIASPIMDKINSKDCSEPLQHFIEKESIKNSIQNLRTFPWIIELIQNKKLTLHGWWFDLKIGEIFCFDEDKNTFVTIDNDN